MGNSQSHRRRRLGASPTANTATTTSLPNQDLISVNKCRSCAPSYLYPLPGGGDVTVICGIPQAELKYKAISHVWGETSLIKLACQRCGVISQMRLRSPTTFMTIMALAGPGSMIWMDNISIDQNDPKDVAAQLAVMGQIYGNAESVLVILPESDREAFLLLGDLIVLACRVLQCKKVFEYNHKAYVPITEDLRGESDDTSPRQVEGGNFSDPNAGAGSVSSSSSNTRLQDRLAGGNKNVAKKEVKMGADADTEAKRGTSNEGRRFFETMDLLLENLPKYKYWQRAWTFQEWVLAHEIEVGLDGSLEKIPNLVRLEEVKSTIMYVSILMVDHMLRRGETGMDFGFTRGQAASRLQRVKQVFPFEDSFSAYDEINEVELLFQTGMPSCGTNEVFGLRPTPHIPRLPEAKFRARLSLMLDAFKSSKREATYEADLICCWASMCNIPYDYSRDDSLILAITKITHAIRQRGVRLFNFHANDIEGEGDVDPKFLGYCSAQRQSNAINEPYFSGAPIFTGQVDTIHHFYNSMLQQQGSRSSECASGVNVRVVEGMQFKVRTFLRFAGQACALMTGVSSGSADGFVFTNVWGQVLQLLQRFPRNVLDGLQLVPAVVFPEEELNKTDLDDVRGLHTWALLPSNLSPENMMIAREETNGTLVLVIEREDGSTSLLAYLALTDQQCGTYLIPVDEEANIDIVFKTPQNKDASRSDYIRGRQLLTRVKLAGTQARTSDFMTSHTQVALDPNAASRQPTQGAPQPSSSIMSNDALIKPIGETAQLIHGRLAELSIDRLMDAKAIAPLEIDLGHPKLTRKL